MNWFTTNNRATNNIHNKYPALMSCGNLYTDWNSACKSNEEIKKKENITDNYEYRQWLIKNSTNIMKQNFNNSIQDTCVNIFPQVSNKTSKYIFRSCNDNAKPVGYESSDLKNLYLSREQLQEKLCAPILSQDQLLANGFSNHI